MNFKILHACDHGTLSIKVRKKGLSVIIDDSLIGNTPIKAIHFRPGTYLLTIQHPKRSVWGFTDWQYPITITCGDTTYVKPEFNIPTSILSTPFDAEVYYNDKYIGKTPLHTDLCSPMKGKLKLVKKKYFPAIISLDTLHSPNMHIKLMPNLQDHAIQLGNSLKISKKNTNRKFTYTLMTFALCSGLATIYLKDLADNNYKRYLKAGTPNEMAIHMNRSKQLDTYSAVSLGVFEASFTFSFYFLFKTVAN